YSPNLNPIERMWKLMNEHAWNNRYFSCTALSYVFCLRLFNLEFRCIRSRDASANTRPDRSRCCYILIVYRRIG
ncbi:hypothetical protein EYW98_05930, partial [Escherichia coli]|nr:hypothetical protein [Escherichia coli]